MTFNSLTYCSLFHATIIMAIGCNWHPWSNNNTKIPFKHFPIPYYFKLLSIICTQFFTLDWPHMDLNISSPCVLKWVYPKKSSSNCFNCRLCDFWSTFLQSLVILWCAFFTSGIQRLGSWLGTTSQWEQHLVGNRDRWLAGYTRLLEESMSVIVGEALFFFFGGGCWRVVFWGGWRVVFWGSWRVVFC